MCFTVVRILKNPLEDGLDNCVIVSKRIFRVVETLPFGSFFSTVRMSQTPLSPRSGVAEKSILLVFNYNKIYREKVYCFHSFLCQEGV